MVAEVVVFDAFLGPGEAQAGDTTCGVYGSPTACVTTSGC